MRTMRRRVLLISKHLLLGSLINIAVAWLIVAIHGKTEVEWKPYHNPRPGDHFVFFLNRHAGLEQVIGCGRPGTVLDRYPDSIASYSGDLWWPPEAVTFDDGRFAVAAGWPFLSFSSWRTETVSVRPSGIEVQRSQHYGLVLAETTRSGWEEFSAVLPLRPIWFGFLANTIMYALTSAVAIRGWQQLRRRNRLIRGLCSHCSYPLHGCERCPECGTFAVTIRQSGGR